MSDNVAKSEHKGILTSTRQLVGESGCNEVPATQPDLTGKLVLTPKLRVQDHGVLRLEPEDAVARPDAWSAYEEPPLQGADDPRHSPALGEDKSSGRNASDGLDQKQAAADATRKSIENRTKARELSAKIAALETAIARTVDQWEPDGASRDAYAGTRSPAMAWLENVDLDATGKPVAGTEPKHTPATSKQALDPGGTLGLDEETLRALVTDIVRAELRGDLGDRITQNLRKLVRREIHRALAAQALN